MAEKYPNIIYNYKATAPSTATHLRQHGYHTAYIGKWHMGIVRDQHPKTVREHPGQYRGESARTPERHRAGFLDWYAFEKEFPYEEAIRNPAIYHCPGRIPAQGARDELFSLVDVLATTCGIAGIPVPPYSQGRDFSPVLRAERFEGPSDVLLEMVANPRWDLSFVDWRAIRTREWKYASMKRDEKNYSTLRRILSNWQTWRGRLPNSGIGCANCC